MIRELGKNRATNNWTFQLLILIALAITAGRIAVVTSAEGDTAFLSANDRSRWCTVASLVERGTYVIDEQIAITDATERHRHPWGTIDKVRHTGSDGKLHHYSSKPPLFPTLVAGVYAAVHLGTGMTMTDQPIYVPRIVLTLVNVPLLAVFLFGTIGVIDRLCEGVWAKNIAAAGACFGTMLLPFSISLNNHLPAAAATTVAMWIYVHTTSRKRDPAEVNSILLPRFMWGIGGAAAAFAAANELPALSMMVLWFLLYATFDKASVLPFSIGVAMVAIGFFGTNWIAHRDLRPPYAHRGNGKLIEPLRWTGETPDAAMTDEIHQVLIQNELVAANTALKTDPSDEPGRWVVQVGGRLFAVLRSDDGWRLTDWDDWYEYPGTYWKDGSRRGVDLGEPSRTNYLFQITVGHHGLFSLTPLWFLLPLGFIKSMASDSKEFRRLAQAVLLASVVCFLFYLSRPMIDRNYGGVSCCFRWLLWFAPLWIVMIAPRLDELANRRPQRIVTIGLLAWSVFSMSTALESPWQSPWIYRFWQFLGWIDA